MALSLTGGPKALSAWRGRSLSGMLPGGVSISNPNIGRLLEEAQRLQDVEGEEQACIGVASKVLEELRGEGHAHGQRVALAHFCRARARQRLGARLGDAGRLEDALHDYDMALRVWTETAHPTDWARVKWNQVDVLLRWVRWSWFVGQYGGLAKVYSVV